MSVWYFKIKKHLKYHPQISHPQHITPTKYHTHKYHTHKCHTYLQAMHKQNPMHKCKCRNFFFSQATPTRETCAPNYKNSTKCRNEIIPFTSSGKSSNCCIPYQSPCALRHTLQSTISVAICPCKKCNTIS